MIVIVPVLALVIAMSVFCMLRYRSYYSDALIHGRLAPAMTCAQSRVVQECIPGLQLHLAPKPQTPPTSSYYRKGEYNPYITLA